MKIKKIDIKLINTPLKRAFVTSLRAVTHLESIIVEISDENETSGFGETAAAFEVTGESKRSIVEAVEYISSALLDRDIDSIDEAVGIINDIPMANNSAKAAVEIALYDMFSKKKKEPLYKFLGGVKTDIKTGITISLNEEKYMVSDALDAVDRGFDSLKIKLGNDMEKDIKRVMAISNALGKNISLRLDANQGWSVKESIKFLKALEKEDINIEFIEQPVEKNDITGLKTIKQYTNIPILADESAFSLEDVQKILEIEAADYINIKLDKCGGISKALQIADFCKNYKIKCMMGCMLEGPISIAAAAHVVAARHDTITMVDLDAVALLKYNYAKGDTVFDESDILLSDAYGLGVGL